MQPSRRDLSVTLTARRAETGTGGPPAVSEKSPPKSPAKTAVTFRQRVDSLLDRLYAYRGPAEKPSGATGRTWLALPGLPVPTPVKYLRERYRVEQMPPGWPSPNECVTAATIQDMNMVQDILTSRLGLDPIPHADLKNWTGMFDAGGLRNWITRPPAGVPVIGGMLLPQQAVRVLKAHARWLRAHIGRAYRVELSSRRTVADLIANLQSGYPTSLHFSQRTLLFGREKTDITALLGGMPHTVTLAGYDAKADTWFVLDPGIRNGYTELSTPRLMEVWGRRFLFYPPRFSMTTLIPDPA
jgi:hypothetical protein